MTAAPRLFVVSVAYRLHSRADKTHITVLKAVLADSPEAAQALALADENADLVYAVKVEDKGDERCVEIWQRHVSRGTVEGTRQWVRLTNDLTGGF